MEENNNLNEVNQTEENVVQPVVEETTTENVQPVPEPGKKKSKAPIIIIIVVIVLILIGIGATITALVLSNKDTNVANETTTTEETTTTTELTVARNGKKLQLYEYTMNHSSYSEPYSGITDKQFTSDEYTQYTHKPFTISCESSTCSFVSYSAETDYIIIQDGKYFSVVTKDDKLLFHEIGKDLIDKGNKLFADYGEFGKTGSGDYYIGLTVGEKYGNKVVLYNLTKNTSTGILNDTSLFCGDGENGCPRDLMKYTDYFLFDITKDYLSVYNIAENKWEDYKIPYEVFTVGNKDKLYYAEQYYVDYVDKKPHYGRLLDLQGNVVKDGLKYVGSYEDKIYVQENDSLKKLDVNLNQQKQITNVNKTYMEGKDFVLADVGGRLKLFDNDLNELTTFIDGFTEDNYYVHTMLSGWFTAQGKNGIYIVVEDSKLTAEDDDMGQGYEYYYIPSTGETGKIRTEIGGYAKPVLYLYPKKETNVKVTFEKPEMLTTTYPKYINSWDVKVKPNGDMYDKNGKYYYALYWEEKKNHEVSFNEGFYVTKDNAITFLEEKLTTIGLNAKERNEFIMYWLPILEKNGQSLVYFELTEERNQYSPINISPAPDSLLRIAMHVKKVDKKVDIKEQKLKTFKRTGFVAVEWGGVIH